MIAPMAWDVEDYERDPTILVSHDVDARPVFPGPELRANGETTTAPFPIPTGSTGTAEALARDRDLVLYGETFTDAETGQRIDPSLIAERPDDLGRGEPVVPFADFSPSFMGADGNVHPSADLPQQHQPSLSDEIARDEADPEWEAEPFRSKWDDDTDPRNS